MNLVSVESESDLDSHPATPRVRHRRLSLPTETRQRPGSPKPINELINRNMLRTMQPRHPYHRRSSLQVNPLCPVDEHDLEPTLKEPKPLKEKQDLSDIWDLDVFDAPPQPQRLRIVRVVSSYESGKVSLYHSKTGRSATCIFKTYMR